MLILKDDGAYAIHLNAEHFDPSSVYPELDYFDALVIELFNQSQIKNRVTERMPWKRVVEIAEQEKGHVLYPTTRTDDREGMFKWVGPISRTIWNLYGISADGWADRSFDDILKNARIGALMGSARESYLRAQGAENLIVMPREELLLPMLMAGRVDLLAIGGNILRHYIDVAASSDDGGGMPEIGGAVAYRTCYLYIAISGDVPDQDISRLQDKLDEFKINGVFTNIRAKFGLSTDEQSPFLQAMLSGENNGVGCVDMNGKP
ncbi:ABC transporter substrate-binding protein [Thalassospira sp. MA62]|nr:ABC transporter substrate-binding protein [Thalassospira sp. MA62]